MKNKNIEINSENITYEQYNILKNIAKVKYDMINGFIKCGFAMGFMGALFGGFISILASLSVANTIITITSILIAFGIGLPTLATLLINHTAWQMRKFYKQMKKANELDNLNAILEEYEKSDRFEKDKLNYEIRILEDNLQNTRYHIEVLKVNDQIIERKDRLQEIEKEKIDKKEIGNQTPILEIDLTEQTPKYKMVERGNRGAVVSADYVLQNGERETTKEESINLISKMITNGNLPQIVEAETGDPRKEMSSLTEEEIKASVSSIYEDL